MHQSIFIRSCPHFVWAGFAETRLPALATPGHTNSDTTVHSVWQGNLMTKRFQGDERGQEMIWRFVYEFR